MLVGWGVGEGGMIFWNVIVSSDSIGKSCWNSNLDRMAINIVMVTVWSGR